MEKFEEGGGQGFLGEETRKKRGRKETEDFHTKKEN